MTKKSPEVYEHYTSYHSDDTYSIFDTAWGNFKRKQGFNFEYNGMTYCVEYNSSEKKWTLFSTGPKYEYLMPWGPGIEGTITKFSDDAIDEFITTFEIEGKTVEWIIKNQREWKYKFSAKHLEQILTGFSFKFVYRKIPCFIYTPVRSSDEPFQGRYISIRMDIQFDPTHYAPSRPGEKPWYKAFDELGGWDVYMNIGPFKTDGELLDTVRFNEKTLRELFDTEYDDRDVLCGDFDG